MINLMAVFSFLIMTFISIEAHVSEVFYMPMNISFPQLISDSQLIVEVPSQSVRDEIVEKIVFPKSTHHSKEQDTVYTRVSQVYKVVGVHMNRVSFTGQEVKILVDEAYSKADIKAYHEENLSDSPVVHVYKEKFKIDHQKGSMVLFLEESTEKKGYFRLLATEGPDVLKDKTFIELLADPKKISAGAKPATVPLVATTKVEIEENQTKTLSLGLVIKHLSSEFSTKQKAGVSAPAISRTDISFEFEYKNEKKVLHFVPETIGVVSVTEHDLLDLKIILENVEYKNNKPIYHFKILKK